MSNAVINKLDTYHFQVEGELNLTTAPDLLLTMLSQFPSGGCEVQIDLEGVTRSDSAGLALLVEWLRLAEQQGITLQFHNLPSQLREIARVSDLLPLLPLA
jgi:phospholipid transport system transporter-binding protein